MTVVDERPVLRSECLAAVTRAACEQGGPVDAGRCRAFVGAYLEHVLDDDLCDADPGRLAGLVRAHLRLGLRRDAGEHLIGISTPRPEHDGWDAGGSTVVQIVTDDRPFLVDTVTMELSRREWSIRRLIHPQLLVRRDADGRLDGLAADPSGMAESWISLEVFPPLGQAASELTDPLMDALVLALDAVAVAVDDWQGMEERALAAVEFLDSHPQPVSPQEVRRATDLLSWLADDNFVFLGYREYRFDGTRYESTPGTGLGILRGTAGDDTAFHALPQAGERGVLVMTKDSRRSPVQRPAYLDYLGVRVYAADGSLVGERRFLGLLAASAYSESVAHIPVLASKAESLLRRSGYARNSFGWNALWQAISTYPRDELFLAEVDELAPLVTAVAALRERRQVRLFIRRGRHGRFWSVLVFLPRDRYNTAVRLRIQGILLAELGGESLEYTSQVSESVLVRLFYVVKLPEGAPAAGMVEVRSLERSIETATRTWEDDFSDAAQELSSEERGVEFGEAYEAAFPAAVAVSDLRLANQLDGADDLRFHLYDPFDADDTAHLRLKVFTRRAMPLTEVMPHLSMLGVDVVDERPFVWDLRGQEVLVYDFGLRLPGTVAAAPTWDGPARQRFVDAFAASYRGLCEAGPLNRLVLLAGLTWRQITWLRGVSRYLLQAGIPFSQAYLAQALNDNPGIASGLVRAFEIKFDPEPFADRSDRESALAERYLELEAALDAVSSLDQDRILRMFLAVIRATVRTNAFTVDPPALAYKLLPTQLPLLPEPRPAYEVFVYSPRVHGVHLRFGPVARGGVRWSDRKEDFRTEVLGLVKAQTVKNAVIVPVGAKGGFVPQLLPDPAQDRAAWLAEGIACYRIFISALLGVTDNIVTRTVVPPERVLRYDGDDPYLVVAADKGTAAFSDIANALAIERGFWLGDAFASGGSAGYDHKRMGITARGAWQSVKRHFIEMGRDCQAEDFTCVGIGDMSGDVFGNGMLLSEHIRLVAAFNHQHVFLDPDADAAVGLAERRRLFELPRSTWADYDPSLISSGGGVYPRTLKSVPVSEQVRRALGLADDVRALPPNEVIAAILRAPVDLLFNGGIGTYVKASTQTHADVGDKANDGVRVNGSEVRARCVAEGGNLGWTQRGRVEYALGGGRINTDFIDNSAGVDTSDHEVNIKILLAGRMEAGVLDLAERDRLLAAMTDEVAQLVLGHNTDQNLALANSMARAAELAGQHEGWMRTLEAEGFLDRALEDLPTSDEMSRRIAVGGSLTRPELATLLAYTKIALYAWVLAGDLPDDPYLADRLYSYFPKPLRERFAEAMPGHPLARPIIATVAVNRFVNSQGITAYHRLSTETGAGVADVIRAQLAARAIYSVGVSEVLLGRGGDLDAALVTELRMELRRMVERAARWLLHNRRGTLDVRATVARFNSGVGEVRSQLGRLITPRQRTVAEAAYERWAARGAPIDLAAEMATAAHAHFALGAVQTAQRLGLDVIRVAEVHFRLAEELGLDLLAASIDVLPRQVRWDAMARAALRDELLALHGELTADVMSRAGDRADAVGVVADWLAADADRAARAAMVRQACEGTPDLARMSVGLGAVRALMPGE